MPDKSFFLINNGGRPVAVARNRIAAHLAASALARNATETGSLEWSDSGKLMHRPEDHRSRLKWTGWEIRAVPAVGDLP